MARGLNETFLRGNLPSKPELRYAGETAVINTQLAINESYKDKDGEWQDRVQWIDVVFWDRNAEVLHEYAGKGSLIFVKGTLRKRQYEDDRFTDDNGNSVTRYKQEVRVIRFDLLDSKGKNNSDNSDSGNTSNDVESEDDLPF